MLHWTPSFNTAFFFTPAAISPCVEWRDTSTTTIGARVQKKSFHVLLVTLVASTIQATSAFGLDSHISELTLHERTSSREILQPRHQRDFPGDKLFDEFARTVCLASAVPRKELYETWATALYVHDQFPNIGRVADLACGHGLLSWALLLLDMQRTAVCVDKRMPCSAEKVANVMTSRWPLLTHRWDYVQGKLDTIEPCSSTLICGVHGVLSDSIISLAIQGNAPLALVPCCYTKRTLATAERQEIAGLKVDLAHFVDTRRVERLEQAGFDVERRAIPEVFTPMNTLIMASPPGVRQSEPVRSHPRALSPLISIPVGNNAKFITQVKALAGRAAAEDRKKYPPPALSVALFLPGNETSLTPAMIASLLIDKEDIHIDYADEKAYLHPNGRFARTFRVVYAGNDKVQAKAAHATLCEQIPRIFPGAQVRL
jgi:hypothetical protein